MVEAEPNPVVKVTDKARGRLSRRRARLRRAARRARVEEGRRQERRAAVARTRPRSGTRRRRPRRRAARAARVPARRHAGQEAGDPDVQGRRRDRRSTSSRAGDDGEGHRHVEGPRLPGRREALRHRRRSEHARQHEAPPAGLDRRRAPIRRASSRARRCPGHYGAERHTQIDLRVEKIDAERNLIYIRGAVAGPDERDRARPQAGLTHG